MMSSLLVVLATASVVPTIAPAAPTVAAIEPGADAAKAQIRAGNLDAARALLEQRLAARPGDVETLFLIGIVEIGSGDHRKAINHFRRALVYEPDAVRIRLELARAFYLAKDYENAFRQFQFARAGHLPPSVNVAIDRFLLAIRNEKTWSYSMSVAIAPNSNINTGTSARDIYVFGLPFSLDDKARRRSGVGLAASGSIEFAPRIAHSTRLRVSATLQRREYKGSDFDDLVLSGFAGPRIVTGKWDLSVLGTASQRWYGGKPYLAAQGIRVEAMTYPSSRIAVGLGGSIQRLDYTSAFGQDGPVFSLWGGAIRTLSPSSTGTMRFGLSRHRARERTLASRSLTAGIGYARDLPGGFSLSIDPTLSKVRYDARDLLFRERRRDTVGEVQLSLLNRRIIFSRFTPQVSYTFVRRRSTIDLYSFNQNLLEIGLTSRF